jgi:hypothetical protein
MLTTTHPKLRRALACTALVSTLSLLSAVDASAAQPPVRRAGTVELSARLVGQSLWDFFASLLSKGNPRTDRGGNKASVRIDPNGTMLSTNTSVDGGDEASVRIDPNGSF